VTSREVSMGRSGSVDHLDMARQQSQAQKPLFGGKAAGKARTSKRKQSSPKKSSGVAGSKTLVMATPAKRSAFSRTQSLPSLGGGDQNEDGLASQQPLSFAALGRSFRPGSSQAQSHGSSGMFGFETILEEDMSLPETVKKKPHQVLVGDTPQPSRRKGTGMFGDALLGQTPG